MADKQKKDKPAGDSTKIYLGSGSHVPDGKHLIRRMGTIKGNTQVHPYQSRNELFSDTINCNCFVGIYNTPNIRQVTGRGPGDPVDTRPRRWLQTFKRCP